MTIIPFLDPADENNVEMFTQALLDASQRLAGLKETECGKCAARRNGDEEYQEFDTPAIAWLYAVTETKDFDDDFFVFAKVCGVEGYGEDFIDIAKQYFVDAVAIVQNGDGKPQYWGMI